MDDFRFAGSFFSCVVNSTFSSKFELDFAESLIRCVVFPHEKKNEYELCAGWVLDMFVVGHHP